MHDRDSLHRFMFEHFPIRGQLVHLDASWRALIEHRDYPAGIRDALGQGVAASLLLASTIKFEGVLSLQLQGDGPVRLMLVQCTDGLGVRGLARYRDDGADQTEFAALLGSGTLTVTLENESAAQRYQGIVPIADGSLADALQLYFENSEQLPTRLWLHADAEGASGMLLQRLPLESALAPAGAVQAGAVHTGAAHTAAMHAGAMETGAAHTVDVEDAWRRVQIIGDTLTPEELRTLSDREILHRLFNEDDVRLHEPSPVYFRCRCSRERVAGMLQGLGEQEIRSLIAERGEVEVRCDFCNRAYAFDAVDAAQLFNAGVATDRGSSVH
jgi:molecular chaperone Hsp33